MLKDRESVFIVVFFMLTIGIVIAGGCYATMHYGENTVSVTDEPRTLRVWVMDPAGNPVEKAQVKLTGTAGHAESKITDSKGLAEFENLPEGQVTAEVKATDFQVEKAGGSHSGELLVRLVPEIREKEMILTLHGSNTIGASLGPRLAKAYLEKLGARDVESRTTGAEGAVVSGIRGDKRLVIELEAKGSSTGFKSLPTGACDIAMASRRIKNREAEALAASGDMKSASAEHILALDGIAVIVNTANPRQQILMEELTDIFTGRITNWKELGGPDLPIQVYARDENSGTFDTFRSLVMQKEPMVKTARRFASNPELSDAVSMDPAGIGFTGLPYVRNARALAVAASGASRVHPTFFTVATEDYPLSRRLYLYTPVAPKNPHTLDFVNFALSDAGQKYVADAGFADLSIKTFVARLEADQKVQNPDVFRKYADMIQTARRLSLNVRFNENSTRIDNRGLRDMERIVAFLTDPAHQARKILLVGFTDDKGDYDYNLSLAGERAGMVASELKARGVYNLDVFSAGEEVPIASNAFEAGRARNRRVEVWIM